LDGFEDCEFINNFFQDLDFLAKDRQDATRVAFWIGNVDFVIFILRLIWKRGIGWVLCSNQKGQTRTTYGMFLAT
jgi:hypothetical protein